MTIQQAAACPKLQASSACTKKDECNALSNYHEQTAANSSVSWGQTEPKGQQSPACGEQGGKLKGAAFERRQPAGHTHFPTAGLKLWWKEPGHKEKMKTSLRNIFWVDTACNVLKNSLLLMNIEETYLTNPSEVLGVSAWLWHRREIWSRDFFHEGVQTKHSPYIKCKCILKDCLPPFALLTLLQPLDMPA